MTSRPFGKKRPFYSSEQIEQVCSEELASVGLLPNVPGAIRIDRFIEKKFGITPEYEELPQRSFGLHSFWKETARKPL